MTVLATPARSCSWAQAGWGTKNRIAALKTHLKIRDIPARKRFYYHASGEDRAWEYRNSSWTPRPTLNRSRSQAKSNVVRVVEGFAERRKVSAGAILNRRRCGPSKTRKSNVQAAASTVSYRARIERGPDQGVRQRFRSRGDWCEQANTSSKRAALRNTSARLARIDSRGKEE